MNHSFNINLILKMTALSVIFFATPTACSVVAHSRGESERYVDDSLSDKTFNLLNSRMEIASSPIIIAGSSNEGLIKCETESNSFHKSLLLKNESSLVNYYQYQTPPVSQEIYNVVEVPESGPEWFSMSISICALIASFGIPYWQHNKERKEAINEGYWVREVIMPKINELAFDVTTAFKNAIQSSQSQDAFLEIWDSTLLPKLGALRDSLYLFNSFKLLSGDIEMLEGICDVLEEKVSDNIDKPNEMRVSDVSRFHSSLIDKLITIHRKIS